MTRGPIDPAWQDLRVAITGGAGFIGSTLAVALSDAGAAVRVLDNFHPHGGANPINLAGANEGIQLIKGDVRDESSVRKLVRDVDVLFNLAGQTSHQASMSDPLSDLEVNSRAQLTILQACRDLAPAARIVYASTRQLYGRAIYLPVDEKHPIDPPDFNAINKISGEHFHRLYNRLYGVRSNIARLTNVYGPRMRICDARQMFLGSWIGTALRGGTFEVWGGEQRRDLSFVDDTVAALIAMAGAEPFGQTFNVGGTHPITLKNLADAVIREAGSGAFVVREMPEERSRIDIGDFFADDRLLQNATGWRNKTAIDVGLKATIDYFRNHLPQYV